MIKYTITVREILSRDIEIEAEAEYIALNAVETMYRNEEIVLDADDFEQASFHVYKKEEE